MKKIILALLIAFSCNVVMYSANDDDSSLRDEIQWLKDRISSLEQKLEKQDSSTIQVKSKEEQPLDESSIVESYMPGTFKIGAQITGIIQGTPKAEMWGAQPDSATGGSYQANIALVNEFSGINGKAIANLRIGEGKGIEDNLSLYSNVDGNCWSDGNFSFSMIYYEQNLCDDKVVIDFGKFNPTTFIDKNKYIGSDKKQFLGRFFNNSAAIEFPAKTGGAHILLHSYDWLEMGYLVMGTSGSMNDWPTKLFHAGRVAFKPTINGYSGNYRLLGWYNGADHTRWSDTSQTEEHTYGVSVSIDQEIYDNLGVFGKFSWQRPSVYNPSKTAYVDTDNAPSTAKYYSIEYMWNTGIQFNGKIWNRNDDICALGIGQAIPSEKMKDALGRIGKREGHFEAYYSYRVNQYLAITPGIQLIQHPYGGDIPNAIETVSVYYLRATTDF